MSRFKAISTIKLHICKLILFGLFLLLIVWTLLFLFVACSDLLYTWSNGLKRFFLILSSIWIYPKLSPISFFISYLFLTLIANPSYHPSSGSIISNSCFDAYVKETLHSFIRMKNFETTNNWNLSLWFSYACLI